MELITMTNAAAPTTKPPQNKAGRREWIGLTVLLLPLLLVSMDVSVLYFAVPYIAADLHPSATQQLWIFDIYGFVLAGLLITMGSLGDRIGRRRLLLFGAAAFGLTSVAAAYAQSAGMLIGARALLGIAGATLMPSTLALIRNMFHDEKQRGTAIAIWTAGLTTGVALGPILSGLLLEHFWWGSVFLINAPFMVLLLILAPMLIPEFRNPAAGRFDLISSVLSLAAVLPVIYGIKEIAADGFSVLRAASLVVGLLFGYAFLRRQQTAAYPMISLDLFRSGTVSGPVLTNVVAMFALTGYAIFTTQYLQLVLDMSPLRAALWSVAPAVVVGGAAPAAAAVVKSGVARSVVIGAGFLIAAAGLAVLTVVRADSALWVVLVGAGVLSGGLVIVLSVGGEMLMGSIEPERAGVAGAVSETGSELGGALGIAVLGSIGTAVFHSHLPGQPTLAGALTVPGLQHAARVAFTDGMNVVAVVAGIVMLAAAVVTVVALRSRETGPAGSCSDADREMVDA